MLRSTELLSSLNVNFLLLNKNKITQTCRNDPQIRARIIVQMKDLAPKLYEVGRKRLSKCLKIFF